MSSAHVCTGYRIRDVQSDGSFSRDCDVYCACSCVVPLRQAKRRRPTPAELSLTKGHSSNTNGDGASIALPSTSSRVQHAIRVSDTAQSGCRPPTSSASHAAEPRDVATPSQAPDAVLGVPTGDFFDSSADSVADTPVPRPGSKLDRYKKRTFQVDRCLGGSGVCRWPRDLVLFY